VHFAEHKLGFGLGLGLGLELGLASGSQLGHATLWTFCSSRTPELESLVKAWRIESLVQVWEFKRVVSAQMLHNAMVPTPGQIRFRICGTPSMAQLAEAQKWITFWGYASVIEQ